MKNERKTIGSESNKRQTNLEKDRVRDTQIDRKTQHTDWQKTGASIWENSHEYQMQLQKIENERKITGRKSSDNKTDLEKERVRQRQTDTVQKILRKKGASIGQENNTKHNCKRLKLEEDNRKRAKWKKADMEKESDRDSYRKKKGASIDRCSIRKKGAFIWQENHSKCKFNRLQNLMRRTRRQQEETAETKRQTYRKRVRQR